MRTFAVVVDPPFFDFDARASERRKTRLREALVAEVAVERFDMCVLGWLTRLRIPDGPDHPFRLDPITRFGQTRSPIPDDPIARFGGPDR